MKKLTIVLLCLLLCFTMALPGLADLGGYSGDSDYGGYDSYDYDYDYDSGSDWDSDWDSGYDDYDDYDYDSSDTVDGLLLGLALDSLFESPLGFVIGIILLAIFFLRRRRRGRRSAQPRNPVPPGAQRTSASSLQPMESYNQLDANFDPAELTEKLSNQYVQMQNAWTAGDLTPLRPFFTDTLYAQFDRQLDSMKQQNLVNYVDRISVLGVTLRGWQQRGGEDHIIAELRTRIVDYTVNTKSGEVVSGSKTAEKFMTYEWDLTRPSGQTTTEADGMQKVNCPNCGAPLSINHSCKCPYCDSVITLEEHGWAICSIRGISQQTM